MSANPNNLFRHYGVTNEKYIYLCPSIHKRAESGSTDPALQKFRIDVRDFFRDKASGKTLDREAYKLLRNHFLREGDSMVIMSRDRLSRNKLHISQELELYKRRRIRILSKQNAAPAIKDFIELNQNISVGNGSSFGFSFNFDIQNRII